ncbi:MAG TPA: lipopolysaccharide transport periplasmic protein LptA [Gammaproteobacteria bacterium]|nr:lipopolysaccharide transport periplasmic protein LptA [Gammaproteobacteria bacterium]
MHRLTEKALRINSRLLLACTLLLAAPLLAADKAQREPVTIEADSAMFDERKGQSIYTGHVVITRGGMQIRADEVTVYTEEDALKRIVANGEPVRFRRQREGEKEIRGEARRLDYRANDEHLLLQDQAWLTQGGNRFSGQRIEYDMPRERVTAAQAGDGSQRVKVTIQPKAKSPSPENGQP